MKKQWHSCYDSGWKGIIVPEAFSHPAKMSYGLLKRILEHARDEKWIRPRDIVVDPFGGIGSTGIIGAYADLRVICVELERKFVDLARKNFVLHNNAWYKFGNPYPVILQGDSRRLCEVVEKADLVVSSPPYTKDGLGHTSKQCTEIDKKKRLYATMAGNQYGQTPGQLGSMKPGKVDMVVSSPPWSDVEGSMQSKKFKDGSAKMLSDRNAEGLTGGHYATPAARKRAMDKANQQDYGTTPGNLGNLKSGDVDAIISSPPYEPDGKGTSGGEVDGVSFGKNSNNLGNLKSGDVDCVISSPPYEGSIQTDGDGIDWSKIKEGGTNKTLARAAVGTGYGKTKGQLAEEQGDTFWQAAKTIVEQCFQILKPGGHAIWVVKSFVRKKKIVDFPGDWQRLCESVGFKTVCIHHAMLVKETTHQTLFGDTEVKRTERKSFFRRLAESKGSPRIDFEVVLCMLK